MPVEHRLTDERQHAFGTLFVMMLVAIVTFVAVSVLVFDHAGIRIVSRSVLNYNGVIGVTLLPFAAYYTFVRFDQNIASACGPSATPFSMKGTSAAPSLCATSAKRAAKRSPYARP